MISSATVLVLALASASSPLSNQGLIELADTGEVLLLPRHNKQPFDAWLFTRSADSCAEVERAMLDVAHWADRFDNIKASRAKDQTADSVSYELDLTVVLSPTIYGRITRVSPGVLRFNDVETKAYSLYNLEPAEDGTCLVRYRIVEERGKSSGWVAILKGLESRAGDAGNYAAAISSARGFSKPERTRKVRGSAAEAARVSLAGQGTMIEIDRSAKYPVYTFRRRVALPFTDVSWSVRNKKGYTDKTPVVKSAEDRGKTATYTIGAFGGRVSFTTDVVERTEVGEVLVIDEKVTGGDLDASNGGWRWRLAPVDGGVDVELVFGVDFVAGSRVMSAMADTDPVARESFMLHVGLAFMADLIGGTSLPTTRPTLAREAAGAVATSTP